MVKKSKEKEVGRLKLSKAYGTRAVNRSVVKSPKQATVIIGGEVYSKDRSRFFKEQWEEEKKQLYFK